MGYPLRVAQADELSKCYDRAMAALRADAVRSRARILDAARGMPSESIRLNDLARDTGLGVGTVYRHFPTVTALLEALNFEALKELVDVAQAVAATASPGRGFADLIKRSVELQLSNDGLQVVLMAPDVSPEALALREEFYRSTNTALAAAIEEGRVRPELSIDQIQRLVCGVEYAIGLGNGEDQSLLLDVMISGLRPTP
jgi:AcrR family transcriptional regulator